MLNAEVVALSRVCTVAQYVVLEANGEVNGIGECWHPPKPLEQFRCCFKYSTTLQGVDVQNFIKVESAVAALRTREKTGRISVHLSVLRHAHRSNF